MIKSILMSRDPVDTTCISRRISKLFERKIKNQLVIFYISHVPTLWIQLYWILEVTEMIYSL
jgi:hypothetical protein